jgi:prophage tail gpP-like protein
LFYVAEAKATDDATKKTVTVVGDDDSGVLVDYTGIHSVRSFRCFGSEMIE